MKSIKSSFPPGTVGFATGLLPRYWEFSESLDNLEVPQGTISSRKSSCDLPYNLNRIVESMKGDWLWMIDDDHQFPPDTLMKLLAHAYAPNRQPPVDVVAPVYVGKIAPFDPVILHRPWHSNTRYQWEEVSGSGLFSLPKGDLPGRSGMLIKKNVLDEIRFVMQVGGTEVPLWFKCGQLIPGVMQEDIFFAIELQRLGHTIWLDQDIVLDHLAYCTVTAKRDEKTGLYRPELNSLTWLG